MGVYDGIGEGVGSQCACVEGASSSCLVFAVSAYLDMTTVTNKDIKILTSILYFKACILYQATIP